VIEPLSSLTTHVHAAGSAASTPVASQASLLAAARRRVAESWDAFEQASDHAEAVALALQTHVDTTIAEIEAGQ
jgi:hypothetical protein